MKHNNTVSRQPSAAMGLVLGISAWAGGWMSGRWWVMISLCFDTFSIEREKYHAKSVY
jgi:hypothetical protein